MSALLHSTYFWVVISTILFVILAVKKGRAPINAMLDARSAKIRADLDEAARLKEEAQALLADIQKKHADAVKTAQKIIDDAKATAERSKTESETRLSDALKRREDQLLDRIARAEAAAVQEIRTQAADIAAKSAEILLAESMGGRATKLVEESITDIPAKIA